MNVVVCSLKVPNTEEMLKDRRPIERQLGKFLEGVPKDLDGSVFRED